VRLQARPSFSTRKTCDGYHMTSGPIASKIPVSMLPIAKRMLGLLLVLSTTVWAQAVCPMMLFPETASHCEDHKAAPQQAAHHQPAEHDCCPRTKKAEPKAPNHISAGSSGMSCCSVDRAPAITPKAAQLGTTSAVVGRVSSVQILLVSSHVQLEIAGASVPLRGVLNLQDDLRI
jgi:hypothetical protein